MPPSPFRRRKAAKAVRNLAIAEAALALARHRVPGARSSKRPTGKLLLLGGAVAAVGAAALLKRDKVAGLLPSRTSEPEPARPAPPQPSNYDAPGPVANTATPIPAPDPHGEPPATIDEAAEEAAAAAEAGAIGGTSSDYAGEEPGEPADEAHRPLAEAGEGESEGREQAEAELADNASYRDAAPSDAERQIDETIEQAGQPTEGETPEPVVSEGAIDETVADVPGGGISGRPFAGLDTPPADPEPAATAAEATPESEPEATPESEPESTSPSEPEATPESEPESTSPSEPESTPAAEQKDDSDDWRTWSGRSINP